MNRYLASNNLPKAIEDFKRNVEDLKKVLAEPEMTEAKLQILIDQSKELSKEIAELSEQKLAKNG